MALIGINSVSSDARKPTTLENIALGVDIASKIVGGGLDAYKTFAIDRPAAQAEAARKAKADSLQESMFEKSLQDDGWIEADPATPGAVVRNGRAYVKKSVPGGKLSDLDKATIDSYTSKGDYVITHERDEAPNKFAVPLRDAGFGVYFKRRSGGDGLTPEAFDQESKLRGEFKKNTEGFESIHEATKATLDAFKGKDLAKGEAGSDIALLYNFIKAMDPGSVVKEGEVKLTQSASPMVQSMANEYRRLINDKNASLLPPELRKSLLKTMAENYQSRRDRYEQIANQTAEIVRQYGRDPQRVIIPLQNLDLKDFLQAEADKRDNFLKKY